MKILRVNSAGFEEGGAESGIVAIQPVLERLGHTVRTLASDARPDMPHFNEYTFRAPHGIFAKIMYTLNFSAYFALRSAIRDYNPDVIHLHTLGSASPLILFALRNVPTIATVHGPEGYTRDLLMWCMPKSDFINEEYDLKKLRLAGIFRYIYYRYINYPFFRIGFRNITHFVTISRYIQGLMKAQGVPSIYIPNGVKMLPYSPLVEGNISPRAVYAGRLEKFKGVEYLLRAVPTIVAAIPEFELTVAGTGRDAEELESLAKELHIEKHVHFLGHVGKAELFEMYKNASIVVVPSIWPENASRSGIESMSLGRPIIGTDVGGTSDWLIDGETGYLIPPKDSGAIAGAMIRAFSDTNALIRMSANARKKAEEYAIERHAEKIVEVYESVVVDTHSVTASESKTTTIMYVTDQLMDQGSAAYVHVSEICTNIQALGHKITLYAPTIGKREEVGSYGTQFISVTGKYLSAVYQPKLFIRLIRDIRTNRPDVLYVRKSQLLFVPAIISRLFSIPLILEINGLVEQDAKYVNPDLIARIFLRTKIFALIEIINVRTARHFVVVAEGLKAFLTDRYHIPENRISLIQNGVNTELFAPRDRVEMRRELGLPEAFTVGYVGSLHRWQGLRCIVAAAKVALEQKPDIHFCIAGGAGADGEYLESFIKKNDLTKNVHLISENDYIALSHFKSAIDIGLCYPLHIRAGLTSPMKIYEYLSSGCPVIASDISGMREEFGDIIMYAEAESAKSLAEKILELANDSEKRETLALNGRSFIEAGHSWRVVAEKILAIIAICVDL